MPSYLDHETGRRIHAPIQGRSAAREVVRDHETVPTTRCQVCGDKVEGHLITAHLAGHRAGH